MVISLYNNKSDPMDMVKQISLLSVETAEPYTNTSLETPDFILSDVPISDLRAINYMYVEETKRYYNILVTLMPNGMYLITSNVDPLMSFKNQILNLTCVIGSQLNEKNNDINDGSKVSQVNGFMQRIDFPESFEPAGINILICAGGGAAPTP